MANGIDQVYVNIINGPMQDPINVIFATSKKSVKIDEPTFTAEYLNQFTREQKIAYIREVAFGRKHTGILEHISFTFEIWGVSRSMSHQAVRNRIASFLEGSLRYCDPTVGDFKYIVPMSIRNNAELRAEYQKDMEYSESLYKKWYENGKHIGLTLDKCKELGRTTLPHSSCTTYTFTMNIASLIMLINKRACTRAEEEFRSVVKPIEAILKQILPEIFGNVGAYCEQYGFCPEGKGCCGRYPTLEQLKESHAKLTNMKEVVAPLCLEAEIIKPD